MNVKWLYFIYMYTLFIVILWFDFLFDLFFFLQFGRFVENDLWLIFKNGQFALKALNYDGSEVCTGSSLCVIL